MSKLLLIKHSNSNHNPDQPPHEWGLTPEGITRAKTLAQYVKPYQPSQLFCSPMMKALHTADLLAQELGGLPIHENVNLAEHSRRTNAPYTTLEAFHDNLRRFFANPDTLIYGDETANEARHRARRHHADPGDGHGHRRGAPAVRRRPVHGAPAVGLGVQR